MRYHLRTAGAGPTITIVPAHEWRSSQDMHGLETEHQQAKKYVFFPQARQVPAACPLAATRSYMCSLDMLPRKLQQSYWHHAFPLFHTTACPRRGGLKSKGACFKPDRAHASPTRPVAKTISLGRLALRQTCSMCTHPPGREKVLHVLFGDASTEASANFLAPCICFLSSCLQHALGEEASNPRVHALNPMEHVSYETMRQKRPRHTHPKTDVQAVRRICSFISQSWPSCSVWLFPQDCLCCLQTPLPCRLS